MKRMGIEDQVCSLELAKKLKELGVEQDSVWYWKITEAGAHYVSLRGQIEEAVRYAQDRKWPPHIDEIVCSAFTVAELGEMLKGKAALPIWTNKDELKELAQLGVSDARSQEMVSQGNGLRYWDDPRQSYKTMRSAGKEADARAKTMIQLIEGPQVTVDGKITIRVDNEEIFDGKLVVRPANNAEDGKDI